jgi:hypothetical protein
MTDEAVRETEDEQFAHIRDLQLQNYSMLGELNDIAEAAIKREPHNIALKLIVALMLELHKRT